MMKLRLLIPMVTFLFSSQSGAHAHLVDPPPRDLNDNIKVAPCGVAARTNTPRTLVAGSTINVRWEETVNHPGKFYLSFSFANDQDFAANRVKTVIDDQDGGEFNTDIVVPTTLCENCTLQLIQSMEEDPMNPSFYYSCADVRIVAPGVVEPSPESDGATENSEQNENEALVADERDLPQMGGCARIRETDSERVPTGPQLFFILGLPFVVLTTLRKTRVPVKIKERT